MTRKHLVLLVAAALAGPSAARAQFGALDAARGAGRTSDAANARTAKQADEALATERAGSAAPAPAAARAPAPASAPLESGASAADQGRGAVPPPDTYTVRPGDTLWDLSGRFLNNPWYWPKIWSYNPELSNPHWIYPGNVLKFYPSADEAPARVEAIAVGEPAPGGEGAAAAEAEEEEIAPVRELEDLSTANLKAPASIEEQEAVAVAGPHRIGYVAPKGVWTRHDTFVTPQQLERSGQIEAAFEEKLMLAAPDKAYARFKAEVPVKVGETYVVFKTDREIRNGPNKELFGYQSSILGTARVVAVDEKAATLRITAAYDAIERGALLGPWTEKSFRPVPPRANGQNVEGRIMGAPISVQSQFAEHQIVFVDRGTADGVQAGNTFKVVRSGDLYGQAPDKPVWDESLPKEDVGELLVVEARENASTALVTRSIVEMLVGDRVEMRAAGGAGGN